jgi:hypothetical protein
VNIDEVAIGVEMGTNNFTNTTQQVLTNGNLFPLPHSLARKTHGKEPLVDDFQSHVVTLEEYLNIMQQKALEKEGAFTSREV